MIIALFFYRLTSAGGAERVICWLASALAERGFKVLLISWDDPNAQSFFPLHPAVCWEKLGFHTGSLDKLRRVYALARVLRANNVQALIGFVISCDRTVYAAAKLTGVKLVVAERNAPAMYQLMHTKVQRWIIFKLMHLADRITLQLPGFVNEYPQSLQNRIEIIPNPVPTSTVKACPDIAGSDGRYTLLTVSRLDERQKRISCLITAFNRLAADYPEWDLRIIGDGPDESELQQLISKHGLNRRVSIEPSKANVLHAYSDAHLFVIPSLWEGFSNSLAEALSHGLPSVGFNGAAGVADLIKISKGGWLASGVDDDEALSQTIVEAMANNEERKYRGKLAAQGMAQFTPNIQFDRWAGLLTAVVQEGKA